MWGVCDGGVVVLLPLLGCVVVVVATLLGMCGGEVVVVIGLLGR